MRWRGRRIHVFPGLQSIAHFKRDQPVLSENERGERSSALLSDFHLQLSLIPRPSVKYKSITILTRSKKAELMPVDCCIRNIKSFNPRELEDIYIDIDYLLIHECNIAAGASLCFLGPQSGRRG